MKSNYNAEILSLGNELLIGRTVDKNSTDISLMLTKEGIKVTRITTIADHLDTGVSVLNEILNRNPTILCITGGLGPTFDDIQLDIIARVMDEDLTLNQEAYDMITKKYNKMNESRKKMAMLPKGSIPLKNSEGTAPGVFSEIKNTFVFSLPGVPREMKAIMIENVIPIIKEKFNIKQKLVEYGFDAYGVRESQISSDIDKLRKKFPDVNFKSHPKKENETYFLSLHTYMFTDDEMEAKEACIAWKNDLESKFGADTTTIEPIFNEEYERD